MDPQPPEAVTSARVGVVRGIRQSDRALRRHDHLRSTDPPDPDAMIAMLFAMVIADPVPATTPAVPAPAPAYTVADVIGRNPDDVCVLAYKSGHWSDWLKADAAAHRAGRSQRASMTHYCDGFIHGMSYKGQ